MDLERLIGYFLLITGLGLIAFAIFSASQIFSGSGSPPSLFNIDNSKLISVAGVEVPGLEVIPSEYLNKSGNLTFFLLFMWFIMSAGGRISSIGVSMINVKKQKV